MAHRRTFSHCRLTPIRRLLGLIAVLSLTGTAHAAVDADNTEPLRCWWRTTVGAIRVGEPFGLILTCAALETDALTAVVDRGRLDPKAIELPPFEVLGGTTAPDLRDGNRVFFQNQYTLRFVNDAFFNQDVPLPELSVVYRLQTRVNGQSTATQGMEQRFAMPHWTVRVVSLVPAGATDIWDFSAATFADVEALGSRGRLLAVTGMSLTALSALALLIGVARSFGNRLAVSSGQSGLTGNSTILRGVVRDLAAVERERNQNGWTADLVSRALAGSRILAEIATGGKVSRQLAHQRAPVAGAVVIKHRWPSSQTVLVSGTMTPKTLGRELARLGTGDRIASIDLEAMHRALTEFTEVAYSDQDSLAAAPLDSSLATVRRLARRLMYEQAWPIRQLAPLLRRARWPMVSR